MLGFISPQSIIDSDVLLSPGVSVWHYSHIRQKALIGESSIIGESVYIGPSVKIGKHCKIQNHAQIYEPAEVADNVFIGPGVILTNDRIPRATTPAGALKSAQDWTLEGVRILQGASIGANSTCIAPITIGMWAMVGAGSVVTNTVLNYSLVIGNPARHVGWVGEIGHRLVEISSGKFECPITKKQYSLIEDELVPLEKE